MNSRQTPQTRWMVLALFVAPILAGCINHLSSNSVYESQGDQLERVTDVSSIIVQHTPLPSAIVDAWFVEEKKGDGRLGPADYRAFCAVEVPVESVDAWTKLLTPCDRTPDYSAPLSPRDWWLDESDFASIEFFAPRPLTGRHNGFVGVSRETGRIYIYSFTM